MKRILDLRSDITAKETRMAAIFAACDKENRSRTADEATEWAKLKGEVEALKNELRDLEEQDRINRASATPVTFETGTGEKKEKGEIRKKFSLTKACRTVLEKGSQSGLEAEVIQEERSFMQKNGLEFNSASAQIPAWLIAKEKRDNTATGGSSGSEGGVNIATEIESIIDVLLPEMVLGKLPVTRFSNLTGNIKFPQASTQPSAGWNTENGTATEKSPTMTSLTLSPKRLAAYIQVSNQLLMQSSNSIDTYIRNWLLNAAAIEYEKVCLKGGGSNEPTGIIGGTGYNAVYAGGAAANGTNANGAAPVWADIVNLVKSLKNANGAGQAYVTSPSVIGKLQVTARQSSGVEGNFIMPSWNGGVNGFPVLATTNLPDTFAKGSSSALSAIIHGDFSKFATAAWGGIEIGVDPYVNMKEGLVNMVLSAYVDCGMLVPTAFSVVKDVNAA
jgi:HK97 family phage major capsid protein